MALQYSVSYTQGEIDVPSEVRFAEVKALLERNGWSLDRVSGSHHIFSKPGVSLLSIPVHRGKVKFGYVRRIRQILDKEAED